MIVIGKRYATLLGKLDGQPVVVKLQDLPVDQRRPVVVHRELVGARLAERLGVPVPETRLAMHPHLGRLSLQRFVVGARPPSAGELAALRQSAPGWRLLLLDLVIGNHDRRIDNLIVTPAGSWMAFDFNVAFPFEDCRRAEEPSMTIQRWMGLSAATLPKSQRTSINAEVARTQRLLADDFLDELLERVPAAFVSSAVRRRLLDGMVARRRALAGWIDHWWQTTVAPVHRLLREEPV